MVRGHSSPKNIAGEYSQKAKWNIDGTEAWVIWMKELSHI